MHPRIKFFIAGAVATGALFAGALPANAATAISEKTGKRIETASYWDDIQYGFKSKGNCESQRQVQNGYYMGKWEGGWADSKCVSYSVQQCPPATKWKLQALSWHAVGGPQSIPNTVAPQAVTAAASC